jgi:hypothetical protein
VWAIDGRMDAELYTNILQDDLLATVEFHGLWRDEFCSQQDNDPKHTSQRARKWFQDNDINVLKWLAQSPDLNLLNVCGFMSRGSLLQKRLLLLEYMNCGSRCSGMGENTKGGLWKPD